MTHIVELNKVKDFSIAPFFNEVKVIYAKGWNSLVEKRLWTVHAPLPASSCGGASFPPPDSWIIHLNWGDQRLISVGISNFTGNCGVKAIQGFYCLLPSKICRSIFLDLVESYVYSSHNSTLVGSDGTQTGCGSFNFVKDNGKDWEHVKTGLNRRVDQGRGYYSYLYWKYLKKNPFPQINWG